MPQEGGLWSDASALAVAVGSVTEAITYTKSASLHLWLLGYEFTGAGGAGQLVTDGWQLEAVVRQQPLLELPQRLGWRQLQAEAAGPPSPPHLTSSPHLLTSPHMPLPRFPPCRDGAGVHQD